MTWRLPGLLRHSANLYCFTTYIVLDVWFAAVQQQQPAGLVVAVLAAQVERREPAPVLDVEICLGFAENCHRLTEAFPGGLV